MAKRTKNTKTYRVRVVNPAPPPGHPARTIVTPRPNPDAPLVLEIRWTDRSKPAQRLRVGWDEYTTVDELSLEEEPSVYKFGYERMSADRLNDQLARSIEEDLRNGYSAWGPIQIIELAGLDDQPDYLGSIEWRLVANDPDAQAFVDEEMHVPKRAQRNPRARNTRRALPTEPIRERKYHKGRSYDSVKGTYRTYWHKPREKSRKGSWAYEVPGGGAKTGFDSEAEAYDWMRHHAAYHEITARDLSEAEHAAAFAEWSSEGDDLVAKYGSTLKNPAFRYGAVPVTDNGTDTVHVVRGHRRADMVRNVARSVPGDAIVDLQQTRTFGTKHEAQAYGSTISGRVRSLSRRIRS